jgi:hypothetical protein
VKKNDLRSEFIKTMTQLATAGFGFVAALAWNNAIQSLIERFISPGSGLRSQVYYAIIVTILAVLVTYYLGRLSQKEAQKEEKKRD